MSDKVTQEEINEAREYYEKLLETDPSLADWNEIYSAKDSITRYQTESKKTAIYPKSIGLVYALLGLSGEVGEMLNKYKKVLRDDKGVMSDEVKSKLVAELGDVMWYVSQVATELDANLCDVMESNLEKLNSRKTRGVIGGSGDER